MRRYKVYEPRDHCYDFLVGHLGPPADNQPGEVSLRGALDSDSLGQSVQVVGVGPGDDLQDADGGGTKFQAIPSVGVANGVTEELDMWLEYSSSVSVVRCRVIFYLTAKPAAVVGGALCPLFQSARDAIKGQGGNGRLGDV